MLFDRANRPRIDDVLGEIRPLLPVLPSKEAMASGEVPRQDLLDLLEDLQWLQDRVDAMINARTASPARATSMSSEHEDEDVVFHVTPGKSEHPGWQSKVVDQVRTYLDALQVSYTVSEAGEPRTRRIQASGVPAKVVASLVSWSVRQVSAEYEAQER